MNIEDKAVLSIFLKKLCLTTMVKQWEQLVLQAENEGWGYAHFLKRLCEQESIERDRRRIGRTLRLYLFHRFHEIGRPGGVADTPAGHGIGF